MTPGHSLPPGAHVYGIGIDLVENSRIAGALEKFGDRFLRRIYLPDEIAYCQSMRLPVPHLAARFAAKEALSKAFGTGIGAQVGWLDLEIVRLDHGAPTVRLHGNASALAQKIGVQQVLISLTHTDSHAAATAALVAQSQASSSDS